MCEHIRRSGSPGKDEVRYVQLMLRLKRNDMLLEMRGHSQGSWLIANGEWIVFREPSVMVPKGAGPQWRISVPSIDSEDYDSEKAYDARLDLLIDSGLDEVRFPTRRAALEALENFLKITGYNHKP